MTSREQLSQDSLDLVVVWIIVSLVIIAIAWVFERLLRRRREPEILPPPIDGRDHNDELIAEWERKRARIDRSEVTKGAN